MDQQQTIPSQQQLEFLDWEIGMFFHFGLRSFYPGHCDWDNLPMHAQQFAPDSLDCNQWMEAARALGAKYTVLTCKHHDGFALWPSKYTDFSVKNSPYREGNGDIVAEYTTACRRYGMKVGLYYSPAQWGGEHSFASEDSEAYDSYFIGQLSELLSNYGTIDYLWLDGCGSEGHVFDTARISDAIRRLQPDILIFGSVLSPYNDNRWIGNEDGYAPLDNYNTVCQDESIVLNAARFMPAECDMMIRNVWFGGAPNEAYLKQPCELFGNYEYTVGRGANWLLNVGPDQHGRIPEEDFAILRETRRKIDAAYGPGAALPFVPAAQEGTDWCISHPEFFKGYGVTRGIPLCNRLVLMEDLSNGEQVKSFRIYANLPMGKSHRLCIYRGDAIGHKHICAFPAIPASKFTLEITEGSGNCVIRSMEAFYVR